MSALLYGAGVMFWLFGIRDRMWEGPVLGTICIVAGFVVATFV